MNVNIWVIYVNCGLRNEYESDLCSNEHLTYKDWKKNSGLYGIWTHDLSDTGAVLYQQG